MSIIVNTTVISTLAAIGQLDLLRRVYGMVHISSEVMEEIEAGLDEGYQFYAGIQQWVYPLVNTGWIRLSSLSGEAEIQLCARLPRQLHKGEASSLAIAQQRGWLFLTDDRRARQEARRLEVALSGTLGTLVLAVERHICSADQAESWLAEMRRNGYRSPVASLASLIK